MRKQKLRQEPALTKGALPRTRSALLKRIKEIMQARATSRSKSGVARAMTRSGIVQRRCCGMEAA